MNVLYKTLFTPLVRPIYRSKLLNRKDILPRRIVICGPPRTGTTLLAECMRSFEDLYVLGYESPAFRFPYIVLNKRFIVTKYPGDIFNIDTIKNNFNDPWVIFMLRDPRDVVVSRHYKAPDKYWVDFSQWKDAVDIMQGLTEYQNLIVIRYEDLISKPEQQQKSISDRIGLKSKFPFTDFYKYVDDRHRDIRALSGIRPISSENKKKWLRQEHEDRIREQLKKYPYISNYLITYRYETIQAGKGISSVDAEDKIKNNGPISRKIALFD